MKAMRDSWTDERLDDMNHRMDEGFSRVDQELRLIRSEIGTLRSETRGEAETLRVEMNAQFTALNTRIDSLQRLMIQVGGGMIAAFLAGFAGLIATQLG